MRRQRSLEQGPRIVRRFARLVGWAGLVVVQSQAAVAGEPIDTGPYTFSSEQFFADDATVTGVITAYASCVAPVEPPYLPQDIALWVTGYTPQTSVNNLGQIDSIWCSQNGQELELGFSDILPYESNGPDVVVFDARPNPFSMAVSVRAVGDSFGEIVLYGPADNLQTNLPHCVLDQWAIGIDFERHGLVPGTVVDRIKIVADCNIALDASEYNITMAAVVDRSCGTDDDCDDQNSCTDDACGQDGFCKFDPHPPGSLCNGGYCDGLSIPHCVACLDDGHCASPTPVCHPFDAICVECVYDTDCAAQTPVCDWNTNTCAPCLSALQCSDGIECTIDTCDQEEGCHSQLASKGTPCTNGICNGDPDAPTCVECLENEDCPSERPYCREDDGKCTECRNDGDCNDFIVCTEDICTSGSCFSYDDSAQCSGEGGGGGAGSSSSTTSTGAGAGGPHDGPPRDDGCDCSAGSRSSTWASYGLVAALALASATRRRSALGRRLRALSKP